MGTWSPETRREKKETYYEKLCTKLALFTRLNRAAQSTKHKIANTVIGTQHTSLTGTG